MALLKRDFYRQVNDPRIAAPSSSIPIANCLYVEREVAHLEATVGEHGRLSNSDHKYCGLSPARRAKLLGTANCGGC